MTATPPLPEFAEALLGAGNPEFMQSLMRAMADVPLVNWRDMMTIPPVRRPDPMATPDFSTGARFYIDDGFGQMVEIAALGETITIGIPEEVQRLKNPDYSMQWAMDQIRDEFGDRIIGPEIRAKPSIKDAAPASDQPRNRAERRAARAKSRKARR